MIPVVPTPGRSGTLAKTATTPMQGRMHAMPGVRKAGYGARDDGRLIVLVDALSFVVPLWIEQVRPLSREQRQRRGEQLSRERKEGPGPAAMFNALAESLALAAFEPGGVTYLGLHWRAS
jgi:hypothetical protein